MPLLGLAAVIFPQHIDQGRQDKTVTLLTGFRNYLHYHLKATKTYMHMRMRKRVAGLLQGEAVNAMKEAPFLGAGGWGGESGPLRAFHIPST